MENLQDNFNLQASETATAVESYRPISLLSTISKLFEKIIITRLLTHVNNINIIIPLQFGFR